MPPIDDRTTSRDYKKPNPNNLLADDVTRLREALDAIDTDVQTLVDGGGGTDLGIVIAAGYNMLMP